VVEENGSPSAADARFGQPPADPWEWFAAWFEQVAAVSPNADAMTLATADRHGRPSARMVLLRGWDARGLTFYTNYRSRKARELAENPHAALLFHWLGPQRQVRIEGAVSRNTAEESDAYFDTRPIGSRLSAIASPQSEVVADRAVLEQAVRELTERHRQGHVPRPAHWGGFRLAPSRFEFWQSGEHRLHDRMRYRRIGNGWRAERLAP
jgi:pyridoxamine 5'-phosphate oxidase